MIENSRMVDIVVDDGVNGFINFLFSPLADRAHSGGFSEINEGEQVLVCVWTLVGEVYNGGFEQYFFNAGGYANSLPHALACVKSRIELRRLIQKAMNVFPSAHVPEEESQRRNFIRGIAPEQLSNWSELTKEFYVHCGHWTSPVLEKLLFEYVCRNPIYFSVSGRHVK